MTPSPSPPYETDVVYTYDTGTYGKGRLRSVTDRSGSKTYTYDQRGRATQTVTTIDSSQYTVSNTYDSADRVTSITYPNASVVAYGYDDGGNLYTVTQDGASRATYTLYNQVGKPRQVQYGNNKITTYAYEDLTFRVHSIFTSGLQNLTYAYDRGGNVTSITDGINSSRTQTFTYDYLNRLSSATSTGYGTLDYAYTEIGNMTLNDRVGTYTYPQGIVGQPYGPAHPHAVSSAGGISYNYDNNGNLTSGNGRTITWHYDNKPRTITAGGTTVTYVYDYAGQRAKKTVGSTTTRYIGKLYECAGSTCTTYIFGGNQRIAKKVGSTLTYYHQDHLGSNVAMSNSSGASAGDYVYYPYGETFYASGSEKYRFTDQEMDNEHGLYNYNAREYDPVLGRFISPDSIVQDFADPQTLNRYSYCRNNPLVYVDPSGHWFGIDDAIEAIVGAIIGAAEAALTGQNILEGAAKGAFSAWVFANTGMELRSAGIIAVTEAGKEVVTNLPAAIGAHMAAGAATGAFNTAISGGNLGQNMVTGAISAGMAKGLGNSIPTDYFGNEIADYGVGLAGHAAIGGITGGITSQLYGGNFGKGFEQGAMAGAYGYMFNAGGNKLRQWVNGTALPWLKQAYSEHRSQQETQIKDYIENQSRGLRDISTLAACGKSAACFVSVGVATMGGTVSGGPILGFTVGGATAGVSSACRICLWSRMHRRIQKRNSMVLLSIFLFIISLSYLWVLGFKNVLLTLGWSAFLLPVSWSRIVCLYPSESLLSIYLMFCADVIWVYYPEPSGGINFQQDYHH